MAHSILIQWQSGPQWDPSGPASSDSGPTDGTADYCPLAPNRLLEP